MASDVGDGAGRVSRPCGRDALLDEFSILGNRAELTLALVEIDPYRTHARLPARWWVRH